MYFDTVNTDDLEILREYRNDWEIRKWCRQLGLLSMSDQHDWYNFIMSDNQVEMFAIRDESLSLGPIPLGVCGLTSISGLNRRAEFSLYIARKFQGNGYAKKALKMLFEYGFNEMNLHLIYGESFDGNPAIAMFEKMGMVKEGTRRDFYYKAGRFLDAHIYSIKKDEFLALKPGLKLEQ